MPLDVPKSDRETEESQGLLADDGNEPELEPPPPPVPPKGPIRPRIQSALSYSTNGAPRTPRTPNRVRFDLEERISSELGSNGHARAPGAEDWLDEEDSHRGRFGQRGPLLTNIEAPSVTLADDLDFNAEELLESARPKSGLKSAFLNMANSIIGAGIIGQAYAFKQAGLTTGIILLIGLTVTVDWTIRLIVINSKLSGSNSFQGTMEHAFGKSGLVAISVAQWAFAFGGMIAFCIIVGDTIPHVISALFPSWRQASFLWLLTNRRAVIILFILGVSYPLSLYRDIAKVRNPLSLYRKSTDCTQLAKASGLALISMLVIIITILTQGARVPQDLRGDLKGNLFINDGVLQAIGVISFGKTTMPALSSY